MVVVSFRYADLGYGPAQEIPGTTGRRGFGPFDPDELTVFLHDCNDLTFDIRESFCGMAPESVIVRDSVAFEVIPWASSGIGTWVDESITAYDEELALELERERENDIDGDVWDGPLDDSEWN
jgi:hypothetical protein